jgi:choline dehydrogenase
VRIPLFNSKLKNTHVDWKLSSATQANANNRTIGVPLGKLLGGSSAFNACLLHRCSPSDYDAWNSSAWTYEQLKPYFRKAENFHDHQQEEDFADVHGTSGPLNATQINKETILGTNFKKACRNYGLPEYHDMTDLPRQIGVTGMQATIYEGERVSAGSSYLPVDVQNDRSNLFIGLGCKVSRLVLDEEKRVTHVEYTDTNEVDAVYKVAVGREAILSAGAILSPFLLMLSGIGPEPELNKLDIQTLVDLPGVGKNLQNHWRVPLVHETPSADMSLHNDIFEKGQESLNRALESKDGALTQLWPDAVAFMKIPVSICFVRTMRTMINTTNERTLLIIVAALIIHHKLKYLQVVWPFVASYQS